MMPTDTVPEQQTMDDQTTTESLATESPSAGEQTGLLDQSRSAKPTSALPDESPQDQTNGTVLKERPTYVPKQFWDETKGMILDEALSTSYNTLRKEFNRLKQEQGHEKAPDKAEQYLEDFKPPHRARPRGDEKEGAELERYGELQPSDPVFIAMSKAAKNANLSKGQFNDMMQDVMEDLHDVLPEPFDRQKQMNLLGENADNIIQTTSAWVNNLYDNGILNEDQYKHLLNVGSTALGVEVVNKLRLNSGERPIPVNASVNGGRKTPEECHAMKADPRCYEDGPVGDAFRAEVDKAFAATYGD